MTPLLAIADLRVGYGPVVALEGMSCSVDEGGALGIVGGEGSGKTVAALTMLGLTRLQGAEVAGRIEFAGHDLLALRERDMRLMRGSEIALVSPLHPFYTVGWQLVEAIRIHRRVSRAAARDRAVDLLELVGVPEPHRRVDAYPHQLPAAILGAAAVAVAVANEPKLLIADEPCAGLDVTDGERILALLAALQRRLGMAVVLFTRDQAAARAIADELYPLSASSST